MLALEHAGNKLYSNSEYDQFSGYVEREFCVEWTDEEGARWRKVVQYINLGRADRAIHHDPDAVLNADESAVMDAEVRAKLSNGQNAAARRVARVGALLQDYLREHGPTPTERLQELVPWRAPGSLRDFLRANGDRFVRLQSHPAIYGLPGQTLADSRDTAADNTSTRIRAVLAEHGPLDVGRMRKLLGVNSSTLGTMLLRGEGSVFVRAGTCHAANGKTAQVWGLVDELGEAA